MAEEPRVVFLRGPRGVVLRPLCRRTDFDLCVRGMNDPEVNQFLTRYLPLSEAEEEKWFERLAQSRDEILLAIEAPGGHYIGNLSLFSINWKNRTAMFGVSIFAKEYWSRGYGADAAMTMFDYAFNRLNLRKINSYFLAFNERSRRLHVALGMKQEGVRRKEDYFNGEYHDELLFGVFREEWEPAWQAYRERHAAGAK